MQNFGPLINNILLRHCLLPNTDINILKDTHVITFAYEHMFIGKMWIS